MGGVVGANVEVDDGAEIVDAKLATVVGYVVEDAGIDEDKDTATDVDEGAGTVASRKRWRDFDRR